MVSPSLGQGREGVREAVANEYTQVAHLRPAEERPSASRHDAIQRDNAREFLGECQAQAVSQRGPFADASQVDALGMYVVVPARLLNSLEDVVLNQRVRARFGTPGVAEAAIAAGLHGLKAPQADTDEVPPAQPGRQAEHLGFTAAVAVQEDHQRVGVIRFVAGWQEGPHGQASRERLDLRVIETFCGPKRAPEKVGLRHVRPVIPEEPRRGTVAIVPALPAACRLATVRLSPEDSASLRLSPEGVNAGLWTKSPKSRDFFQNPTGCNGWGRYVGSGEIVRIDATRRT